MRSRRRLCARNCRVGAPGVVRLSNGPGAEVLDPQKDLAWLDSHTSMWTTSPRKIGSCSTGGSTWRGCPGTPLGHAVVPRHGPGFGRSPDSTRGCARWPSCASVSPRGQSMRVATRANSAASSASPTTTSKPSSGPLRELERLVLTASEEATEGLENRPETFATLRRHLDADLLGELASIVAVYDAVAPVLRSVDIDVQPDYEWYLEEFPLP